MLSKAFCRLSGEALWTTCGAMQTWAVGLAGSSPALRGCHHTRSGNKYLCFPASPVPLLLGYWSHFLLALVGKSPAVPDVLQAPPQGQTPAIQSDKPGNRMNIYPCFSSEEQGPRETEAGIASVAQWPDLTGEEGLTDSIPWSSLGVTGGGWGGCRPSRREPEAERPHLREQLISCSGTRLSPLGQQSISALSRQRP